MIIKHEKEKILEYGMPCESPIEVVYFKQSPTKRIINVQSNRSYAGVLHINQKYLKNGKYFLSMPSVVFKIRYVKYGQDFVMQTTKICFNIGKNAYKAPLLNVDFDGLICLGERAGEIYASNLKDLIKEVINRFWTYEFNEGFRGSWTQYRNILCDYEAWQKKTKENPNWIPEERLLVELEDNSFKEALQNDN